MCSYLHCTGKVTNISHDTTELERVTALKNSWEEKANGRTERAAAALAYHLECKRYEEANIAAENNKTKNIDGAAAAVAITDGAAVEGETPASLPAVAAEAPTVAGLTAHHRNVADIPLTPAMAESLCTALNAAAGPETEAINERYTLVHKLPKVSHSDDSCNI